MSGEDSALSYLKGPSGCHRRTQNISPDSRVDIPVGSREPARGHPGPCSSTRPRGATCLRPQMLGRLPASGTPALVPAIPFCSLSYPPLSQSRHRITYLVFPLEDAAGSF